MSKEFKRYQKEIAGRMLTVDINRVAAQANGDVYYPDIKFVYDTTKIEMSQYYFDCYYIRNNSKYNITFCRDAVSCLDQAYEWFSKRLLEI